MKNFSDLLKNQYTLSDYTNDLFLYHIDLEFSKNINQDPSFRQEPLQSMTARRTLL